MFDRYNTVDEEDAKDAMMKLNEFLKRQENRSAAPDECSHSAPTEA
jgi:hypothetical protein